MKPISTLAISGSLFTAGTLTVTFGAPVISTVSFDRVRPDGARGWPPYAPHFFSPSPDISV